jgi:hypothetical protein
LVVPGWIDPMDPGPLDVPVQGTNLLQISISLFVLSTKKTLLAQVIT